ncbi:DUF805 domain-containing protein [Methylobacterium trifolii]|uniref:Inner membrane protein YhaI n=1 Tax=Methylobacterium trifolii TaxID=1003092 RepID=A0ABQ4TYX7_9HYPH|nr:DUF805 domain-containing protein [Methylobacterium trifolii]GJE60460.1 Inner membrane protein YhaI [Methylobacterium trifolii]
MRWYLRAMRRYASFGGRSPRVEFFEVFGGLFLFILVAEGFDVSLLSGDGIRSTLLVKLVILVHILPVLAVTARRLHDLGWSGWFSLLNLVPVVGFVVLLLVLPRGVRGPNRYGPDPLDPAATEAAVPPQPAASRLLRRLR